MWREMYIERGERFHPARQVIVAECCSIPRLGRPRGSHSRGIRRVRECCWEIGSPVLERRSHDARVGGSNPLAPTNFPRKSLEIQSIGALGFRPSGRRLKTSTDVCRPSKKLGKSIGHAGG